jgi:RsmE family RNA methyltransferase
VNLIILTENDKTIEGEYCLDDYRAEHIRDILKLKDNDILEIGLLNGPSGKARIESQKGNKIFLSCLDLHDDHDISPQIDIICALPRPQILKKVLLYSAMMGVRRLHLIRANRVEKSYFQSPLLEPKNYTSYLIEGLSQGKLTRLPEVQFHDRFRRYFEDIFPDLEKQELNNSVRLLPDPESENSLAGIFTRKAERITIAVGPEGGWVPFEIELMERLGFLRYALGRWVLRVESAIVAAIAQIESVKRLFSIK